MVADRTGCSLDATAKPEEQQNGNSSSSKGRSSLSSMLHVARLDWKHNRVVDEPLFHACPI
jgi:hypothetical protein